MQKIIFLRHSKLVLPYLDHSEMPFDMLSKLGTGELNPPIDIPYTEERLRALATRIDDADIQHVFASPFTRCQKTAEFISAKNEVLRSLQEVEFDLQKMDVDGTLQKDFGDRGISVVNTAVFTGMIEGTCETIDSVYARVRETFNALPQDGTVLCITHDFLMRIIEIFIKRSGRAYEPISLQELESTQRNGYLCGFATDRNSNSFESIE